MGIFSRAAKAVGSAFAKRPSGAVRAVSHAMPLATRTWRELHPDDALTAMQQAQAGSPRLAADFCDALLTDDRVGGVLDTRTLGMLGLPLHFEGETPAGWYDLAPEGELARLLMWGLLLGVGFARVEANGALRCWHPRSFDFDRCTGLWYVTTSEGREVVSRCTGEWIIYEPYGAWDSVLSGLWVSLALPMLVKVFSLHDRAKASEVFGSAMIVGKGAEGSTETQRKDFLSGLRSLGRSARTVLPDGWDLDLLEAQGQTWGIYQQAIEWADNAITIRIAGQLVTTTGAGAFSRGDVHEKIARSFLKFGEATFSTCLSKEYVTPVWGIVSAPRWQTASPDELIGEGSAFKAFADGAVALNAVLAADDLEVDVSEYLARYGVMTRPKAKAAPVSAPAPIQLRAVASSSALRDPRAQYREAFSATIIPDSPPTEFRIFKKGANVTDYGTRYYTDESARLILAAMGNRDVMIDLEHLSLYRDRKNYDPNARGSARLQARKDGLYAVNVKWTADGEKRIRAREQRGISPVSYYRKSDSVITSLHNLALTAQPATHDGVILIAAARGNMLGLRKMLGLPPEATIEDILKALGLDASASAEDTLNALAKALEASGGEDAPEDAPADAPPAEGSETADAPEDAPPADDKEKQAASRKLSKAPAKGLDVAARLAALENADALRAETSERETLIASRMFKPWEAKMLASASIETVRTYVQNAPKGTAKVAAAVEVSEVAASGLEAVAKATGMSVDSVRELNKSAKKGA